METQDIGNVIVVTGIGIVVILQLILIIVAIRTLLKIKRAALKLKQAATEGQELIMGFSSTMKRQASLIATIMRVVRFLKRHGHSAKKE